MIAFNILCFHTASEYYLEAGLSDETTPATGSVSIATAADAHGCGEIKLKNND